MRKRWVMMLGLRSLGGGQGGVEAHVSHLAAELSQLGHSVTVVVRSPYVDPTHAGAGGGIDVRRIWSTRGRATEAILHSVLGVLYAAVRRPDILHVHAVGPALVAPLARALGLRVVMTHHGEDYLREKWGPFARAMLRLGEWCGAYFSSARICVSASLSKELTKRYGAQFCYIPNGVRRHERSVHTGAVEQLGLKPGKYLLHVGRVVPEKRQLDMIDLIDRIGSRYGLQLALVGAADHASTYSRAVEQRAARSPGTVLCGQQSGQVLADLFSHCAVFVLPSSHEGLPIALLEAMSFGCRVVASDIQANLNVGLEPRAYFPVGDLASLEAAVDEALTIAQPVDWREKLSEFEWNRIATSTVAVYESALG